MIWSPTGPAVQIANSATQFVAASNVNLGGVARLVNVTAAAITVTLGGSGVTNTLVIPVPAQGETHIAYGAGVTHGISSAATGLWCAPGISRP